MQHVAEVRRVNVETAWQHPKRTSWSPRWTPTTRPTPRPTTSSSSTSNNRSRSSSRSWRSPPRDEDEDADEAEDAAEAVAEEYEVEDEEGWWSSRFQRTRMEDMLTDWEAKHYEDAVDDIPDVFYKKDRITKHQKTRGMIRRRKK